MTVQSDKQRLYEEIWRDTFGDSEDFIALYSREVFDPRRTHLLTDVSQSRSLSHVQYLPYKIRYRGDTWLSGYISGAATQSDQRGKGLVQHLMRASHQQMWRDGCLCAFLIPAEEWLYRFYQQMGYATLYGKRSTSALDSIPTEIPLEEAWFRYRIWQEALAQLHPTVTHSFRQWHTFLKSLTLEGGGVGTLGANQYYYYKDAQGHAQSILTIPPKIAPADNAIELSTPFAMLRPLRITQLLEWSAKLGHLQIEELVHYALYDDCQRIVFDLLDEHIPMNSGRYSIMRHSKEILFSPRPSNQLCRPLTPDQLLVALPFLQHTLVYAMME